jgi:hypothetical protein
MRWPMRWWEQLWMRLQMLLQRGRAGARLDQELQFHLDQQIAENLAAGMSAEEARHAAMRAFGNPSALRDQARETWSWSGVESVMRDMRIALRTLLRAPGFAAIAVLVMALGIGANVALFTVVRSVLLKPLPYPDPDRLVMLYEHVSDRKPGEFRAFLPVDGGSFGEWQKTVDPAAAQLAMVSPWQSYNVSAEGGRLPENVDAAWSSWNFFRILGVEPALGRSFTPSDDKADGEATAMLSSSFWKRRYGGDPAVIGRKIWLDARPYTIIGVLPSWFVYSSSMGGSTVQIWTAAGHEAGKFLLNTFEDHEFLVVGRLGGRLGSGGDAGGARRPARYGAEEHQGK